MSIQTDVSTHGGKITFQETENRCTAKTRKSRITKEKREGETGHLSPLWTAGQDTELFAYRTERIQKQRIRLKDSPKEQFLLKHHPARNWNLAEILYDAS